LERIGDTWYYRRVVPPDARDVFRKRTIRVSLRTTSRAEATRLEKKHDVDFEARLYAARVPGPGRYQKNRVERLRYIAKEILKENSLGPWDQEFAKIPQADRIDVSNEIQRLFWQRGYGAARGQSDDEVEAQDLPFPRGTEPSALWAKARASLVHVIETFDTKVSDPTIEWAYEQWLKTKHRPQQTQDEARRYLEDFKKSAHLRTLAFIRRRHMTDWRETLRDAGNLAPKSINHRLEIVSAILRTGWREAEIPARDLERINLPEPVSSGRTSWSRDELRGALQALEPRSWSAWVFVIALTTGTRLGELVAAVKEWYDPVGCIHVPAQWTKMRKPHAVPIIELIRKPLVEQISSVPAGDYMFNAPRPAKDGLKISHEASKWFSRFRDRHNINKVFHELRHTWVEAARESPIKKEIYEIISGHAATTVSDRYGGAKPHELIAANEDICRKLLDPEMTVEVRRLVG
jgi:integrase